MNPFLNSKWCLAKAEMIKTANLDVPYIGLYRNKGILILNANVGGEFTSNAFATYYNFYKIKIKI